jgi:hypothetical protein
VIRSVARPVSRMFGTGAAGSATLPTSARHRKQTSGPYKKLVAMCAPVSTRVAAPIRPRPAFY